MKANTNIAELIRRIQFLANKPRSVDEEQEFDFYITVYSTFSRIFASGCIETIVPLCLKHCPLKKAQELAKSIGLQVVQGGSAVYLAWSENLDDK